MEPKLLIHVTYQAKPGRGREFVRQIVSQGLRGKILAEDGCLQYDYFFSSESDDTVYFSLSSGKPPRIRPST